MRLRSPSRHDVLEQSRRKRSCSDYAKFETDWRVDKRGGTLRDNKKPWIKGARFGSNRLRAQDFNKEATEHGGHATEVKVLPRLRRVAFRDEKVCLAQNRGAGETTREWACLPCCATIEEQSDEKWYAAFAERAMDRKRLCPTIYS
jgi:hypothetical protein